MNFKTIPFKILLLGYGLAALHSCATYGVNEGKNLNKNQILTAQKDGLKLFLIGDAGNADEPQAQKTLDLLKQKLDSASENSMLIFLGDNIYPTGMPAENSKDYRLAKLKLENQLKITKNFKGKTLVIPGNHDWYHGLAGLKAQENFVKNYLNDKKAFLPKNGCPLETLTLNKSTELIIVDSEWYLADWNRHYGINKDCDIKTREDFFSALEDEINKNQNKTVIIAVHHPIISSGVHSGFNSFNANLFPFKSKIPAPVLSSALNAVRKASGASVEDLSNVHYAEFAGRMKSLIQLNKNVIVISGHDHNLQYHEDKNIRQIISGAGSKTDPATIVADTDFSSGGSGFAVLDVAENGASTVDFFSTKNGTLDKLASVNILENQQPEVRINTEEILPEKFTASVYPIKFSEKSAVHNFLWGEKYSKYFGIPVEAKVADLTNLHGGLTPLREGGGHQSNSLRFINPENQVFTFRQLSKSASRFLRTVAFKKNSFGDEFENTFAKRFLLDFYTSNHPYTPFAVGNMAEKLGIFHTNPKLFYLPKQNTLGRYNAAYGDKLYMVEEQLSDDPKTLAQFGDAEKFEDTESVIRKLQEPDKYKIDEKAYIRARLFDILIGDWDRHQDQWKWAAYKKDGKTLYRPVPKDRDQAFSKYGGKLLPLIMSSPPLRHMKTFEDHLKNVRWLNREPYPLDLIFAKNSTKADWLREAEFIQKNLNQQDVDEAFRTLPKEVQDETITDIKNKIIARKNHLTGYATDYYNVLQEKIIITGTEKDDLFSVEKLKNLVKISVFETKKTGENELISEREYPAQNSKEIWIYGLNGKDKFVVKGDEKTDPNIRLIGGYDEDSYEIANGKKVKIYDFKSEKNHYTKGYNRITDDYKTNMYDYRKPIYNYFAGYPLLNYNPDDGVFVSLAPTYTVNNFILDPYTQKHILNLSYALKTGAFVAKYKGIFKQAISLWDLQMDALYATPSFTQNFFGLSNESKYNHERFENDYNRVRMSRLIIAPTVSKKSWQNIRHSFQARYENIKVENTPQRIVAELQSDNIFKNQQFADINHTFGYENIAQNYFPEFGMNLTLNPGWKTALERTGKNYFYIKGNLNLDHRIDKKGHLVIANSTDALWLSNNKFEFYQAANIGGDKSLRSFRNDRFSGRSSFVNSSDIRWNFGRLRNGIAPMNWGLFGGYDFGRVWNDGENSRKWHQSYGGGIWLGVVESISARAQYFQGADGGRFSAGIGFGF